MSTATAALTGGGRRGARSATPASAITAASEGAPSTRDPDALAENDPEHLTAAALGACDIEAGGVETVIADVGSVGERGG